MNIKLFFVHPKNYGNMMMAASFIHYSSQMLKAKGYSDITYYLDVIDDEELELVRHSISGDTRIKRENLYNQKRRGIRGKLEKLLFVPVEIRHNTTCYDACIILGGDCISEYYSRQRLFFNMIKFHFISKHIPVYALGQTMGPFSFIYKTIVRWGLKNSVVYARDSDCYEYMKNVIKIPDLRQSRDLALLNIPFQNDCETVNMTMHKFMGKTDLKYITFVPSGANLQYTEDTDHYVEEYIRMITQTIEKYNIDVLLLAHVIHTNTSDDKRIIDSIVERIPESFKKRIHCVNYLINPYEARILIGHGLLTITGRMHAAVSSLNLLVAPICLSYSVKYKGVIGDPFGLNEYILQCRGNEAWKGHQVSTKIGELEEDMLNGKSFNKKIILEKLNENKALALKQIEETVEELVKM